MTSAVALDFERKAGKFARLVLCTKNIDHNGRFCMASAAVANQRVFGVDRGLPYSSRTAWTT